MDHKVLYERYRTIAYERANPESLEQAAREFDANFASLIPSDSDSKILDIGCGMGKFLYYLKKKGFRNPTGVEISPEQVEYCKQNVTDQVILTDNLINFINQRHDCWDCIVMLDVIEHIPRQDVIPILAAIHGALSRGGVLLIETGNMASLTGPYLRYIDFTHESGFTENSLRQVLRAVGFSEIRVTGNKEVVYSWRTRIFILMRRLWESTLRLIYRMERGWDSTPDVLSKLLIAQAKKSAP